MSMAVIRAVGVGGVQGLGAQEGVAQRSSAVVSP
jgi:hypothetical protein